MDLLVDADLIHLDHEKTYIFVICIDMEVNLVDGKLKSFL